MPYRSACHSNRARSKYCVGRNPPLVGLASRNRLVSGQRVLQPGLGVGGRVGAPPREDQDGVPPPEQGARQGEPRVGGGGLVEELAPCSMLAITSSGTGRFFWSSVNRVLYASAVFVRAEKAPAGNFSKSLSQVSASSMGREILNNCPIACSSDRLFSVRSTHCCCDGVRMRCMWS